MVSTVVVIALASVVIFWHAPFSSNLIFIMRMLHRRWREVVLVILLLALITTQTHTSPSVNFSEKKTSEGCTKS